MPLPRYTAALVVATAIEALGLALMWSLLGSAGEASVEPGDLALGFAGGLLIAGLPLASGALLLLMALFAPRDRPSPGGRLLVRVLLGSVAALAAMVAAGWLWVWMHRQIEGSLVLLGASLGLTINGLWVIALAGMWGYWIVAALGGLFAPRQPPLERAR